MEGFPLQYNPAANKEVPARHKNENNKVPTINKKQPDHEKVQLNVLTHNNSGKQIY